MLTINKFFQNYLIIIYKQFYLKFDLFNKKRQKHVLDLPWGPIFNPSSSVRSFVTSFSWDWTKGIFLILTQRCKMVIPKMWRSSILEKKDLPVTRSGNVPEKVFSGFFWNFIISFSLYFFFFDCVLVLPSMCRKPFSELFFTGRSVEPEILRKSSFFVFPWHFLIIYDYFFTEECISWRCPKLCIVWFLKK